MKKIITNEILTKNKLHFGLSRTNSNYGPKKNEKKYSSKAQNGSGNVDIKPENMRSSIQSNGHAKKNWKPNPNKKNK